MSPDVVFLLKLASGWVAIRALIGMTLNGIDAAGEGEPRGADRTLSILRSAEGIYLLYCAAQILINP